MQLMNVSKFTVDFSIYIIINMINSIRNQISESSTNTTMKYAKLDKSKSMKIDDANVMSLVSLERYKCHCP